MYHNIKVVFWALAVCPIFFYACKKEESIAGDPNLSIVGNNNVYIKHIELDTEGFERGYGVAFTEDAILVSGAIKYENQKKAFLFMSFSNGELNFSNIDENYERFSSPSILQDSGFVCLGHPTDRYADATTMLHFNDSGVLISSIDLVASMISNLSLSEITIQKLLVNQQGEILVAGNAKNSSLDSFTVVSKLEINGTILNSKILPGQLVYDNFGEIMNLNYVLGRQRDTLHEVVILNNQLEENWVIDASHLAYYGEFDVTTRSDLDGFYINLSKYNNDGSFHSGAGLLDLGKTLGMAKDGGIIHRRTYFDKYNSGGIMFSKDNSPGGADDWSEHIYMVIDEVYETNNGMLMGVDFSGSTSESYVRIFRVRGAFDL